jgi:hypothetical protein
VAGLGQAGLQRLQGFTMLRQLLGKLGHLGGHLMEQSHDRRFSLFKGRMDVFIGRHAKVHGTDHKQNGPGLATILGPE